MGTTRKIVLFISIGSLVFGYFFYGCKKDDLSSRQSNAIERVKNEYNLKEIDSSADVVNFSTIQEVEKFLQEFDRGKKFSATFGIQSAGSNAFFIAHNNFSRIRMKSGSVEADEYPWDSSVKAGLFSSFRVDFNTSGTGNNRSVVPGSVVISTTGLRIGWSWTQNTITMQTNTASNASFIVKGTLEIGLGIDGFTLGYDRSVMFQVSFDYNSGMSIWTEL